MIVILGTMQRSGSRWYYNMINDLMVAAGGDNAHGLREKFGLRPVPGRSSTHLRRLYFWTLMRLDRISRQGHTFVLHTHRGPSPSLRMLMATGRFKANYLCRDLRDVVVSALDRSKVMHTTGQLKGRHFRIGPQRSFARLRTVKGATLWARWQLMPRWAAWMRCKDLLVTRYEDLVADTHRELKRFAAFVDLGVSDECLEGIIAAYRPERGGSAHHSLVKGVVGRYKEVLTPEQQALCRKRFGRYLEKMGYLD